MPGRLTVHVDPGVYRHQKTQEAARRLGLDPCKVVYHLTQMWALVHRRKTGGRVLDLSTDVDAALRSFASAVGYGGGGKELVMALLEAGFLDARGSAFFAHDWGEWQGARASRQAAQAATNTAEDDSSQEEAESDLPRELRGTNYFGQFMWWLVEGFGFRGYDKSAADPGYFKNNGDGIDIALAAETYIAIASGLWGDDFDKRVLSGRHALNKVSAFGAYKRRKGIGTLIPLTPTGSRYHPTAGNGGGGLGAGDAGSPSGGSGSVDPFAHGDGSYDMGNHPKYGG